MCLTSSPVNKYYYTPFKTLYIVLPVLTVTPHPPLPIQRGNSWTKVDVVWECCFVKQYIRHMWKVYQRQDVGEDGEKFRRVYFGS